MYGFCHLQLATVIEFLATVVEPNWFDELVKTSIVGLTLMSQRPCWCTGQKQKFFRNLTLLLCKTRATFCFCFAHQRECKPRVDCLQPPFNKKIATFRLQYEDDYEYKFSVLSTRSKFERRKFSKCACSELETRTCRLPRTPIWRSLVTASGWRRQEEL